MSAGESNRRFDTNTVRGSRARSYFRESIDRRVRVLRGYPGLLEAKAVGRFPRSGFHKLVEEFDGFGRVAGFFEKGRSGIEIFIRIAHDKDQTAEKLDRTRSVTGSDANLGEAQEVGGD